ncbi:hypothetical protein AGABI1DRAFT_135078 [Agaricus bisporus var. burnettii JB137-S8]|uniref:Uncharacterized protein n=1 Tax=Agaricus bisporus var. burnettii (strain JB137-S8 / ATCC MYA-4627 / FGSC 10392) TaxID=597362 RepID=K5XG05_AGABU|nr:uncharacterized protein AGABI1DRAFT_135078 [Agaricus bisporus var. burnettii JB137-S8]EKM73315.1 hypothetical protein AGABI1DRAFT_135078 [Agaricus bisporus var. burnettii JB137-S8]
MSIDISSQGHQKVRLTDSSIRYVPGCPASGEVMMIVKDEISDFLVIRNIDPSLSVDDSFVLPYFLWLLLHLF